MNNKRTVFTADDLSTLTSAIASDDLLHASDHRFTSTVRTGGFALFGLSAIVGDQLCVHVQFKGLDVIAAAGVPVGDEPVDAAFMVRLRAIIAWFKVTTLGL